MIRIIWSVLPNIHMDDAYEIFDFVEQVVEYGEFDIFQYRENKNNRKY